MVQRADDKQGYGRLRTRQQRSQRKLNAAYGNGSALKSLCPLAGGAGVHRHRGGLAMQAGSGFRQRLPRERLFRVVQNPAGSHPSADQHKQPGCDAARFIHLEMGAKHKQADCTLRSNEIAT